MPRTKRAKICSPKPSGSPGPSSATSSTAPPVLSRGPLTSDGGARRRVANGVLDQVEDEPVELVGVAVDRDRRRLRLQPDLCPSATVPRLGDRRLGDLGEVARAACARAPGVGAGEQQEVGDEAAHPLRGAEGAGDDLLILAVGGVASLLEPRLQQLEVGEDAGQRRAQLVRGVGDELALSLHHLLGLRAGRVELAEHLVERARQLADLVVGLRHRQPAARGRGSSRPRAPLR